MDDKETEVMFHCYSEKISSACIGFGICVNSFSEANLLDYFNENSAYFEEGFWEMSREFEPGAKNAEEMVNTGKALSIRDAVKEVFGHFQFYAEADGVRSKLNWDMDEGIYSLIEQLI